MAHWEQSDAAYPQAGATQSWGAIKFLNQVYLWMFFGLALTSAVSWITLGNRSFLIAAAKSYLFLIIAELILVLVLSAALNRLSGTMAAVLFLVYSALNGLTLSVIMAIYTGESVTAAFLSAACLFGSMSLYGYFTKRDLSGLGGLLRVGLIALIVCMLANFFVGSSGLSYGISIAGIVIFLGLTAYDTQKILKLGGQIGPAAGDWGKKAAIMGALTLYLDFINLFLFILRLSGKRK